MKYALSMNEEVLFDFNRNWRWFLGWGIAFSVLGLLAITYATAITLISVIFLGAILVAGGIVLIVDAYQFWWGRWSEFLLHAGLGLLYALVGLLLIIGPAKASLSLTLLLAIFYIGLGVIRIIYTFILELPHRGWRIANGLVAILLGVLIISQWPASGLFVIGLFVGVDLLIVGWVYIMAALSARAQQQAVVKQ